MFKDYSGTETLLNDGFEVTSGPHLLHLVNSLNDIFEKAKAESKDVDIFRTKLGDIKQIQNLHTLNLSTIKVFNKYCENAIGAKSSTVLNNQFFCKPPNYKMTSAHQDNAYFDSNENVATFWLPLQDVDLLNSCMFYVPKSHKLGLVKHDPIGTNTRIRTGKKGVSLYSSYFKNIDFVKVPMKKGSLLMHDKNTMHFSSPNLTDDYRIALTCILKYTL